MSLKSVIGLLVVWVALCGPMAKQARGQAFGPFSYFIQRGIMKEAGITYVSRESWNRLVINAQYLDSTLVIEFNENNDTARFQSRGRRYLFHYSQYKVIFQRDDSVLVNDSTWNLPSNLFMEDTLDKRLFFYGAHAFVFRNLSRLTIRVGVDSNALTMDDLIINCMCPDKRNADVKYYLMKKYKPKVSSWLGDNKYLIYGSGFKEAFMQYKLVNTSGTMTLEEILANE